MKTSILVSSFAALCLLITFAEAPRRHGEEKTILASAASNSIISAERATMLPGVVIAPRFKKEDISNVPITTPDDFSYLHFNVAEYSQADPFTLGEPGTLPEASEADYNYLKFNISDYSTDSEFSADEMIELPVNENNSEGLFPAEIQFDFSYLKFDLSKYYNSDSLDCGEEFELPEK